MCTVSFIPKGNSDFIFTSNRDETPLRKTLSPQVYEVDGVQLLFPKDEEGGGTWIGVSENERLVCLLNGGFDLHRRTPPYRLSRGQVVKDFLMETDVKTLFAYDLENIEPFTLLLVDWKSTLVFYELVWDGKDRHVTKLPIAPRIWSSSTLYTDEMKELRRDWFATFMQESKIDDASVMDFHLKGGVGDKNIDTVMDRGFVKTVSVTQVVKKVDQLSMRYDNLLSDQVHTTNFETLKV